MCNLQLVAISIFYHRICVTCAHLRISGPHTSDRNIISYIFASASHLRIFISQIFISDLYIFTFIFRSSYFETTSCLHTFGSSSSSHTVLILSSSRFHHAIIITTLQLDIFTSSKLHLPPLSGQPSSSSVGPIGNVPMSRRLNRE